VRALGHRLGNHTWTHNRTGLTGQLEQGGDIVDELKRTAAVATSYRVQAGTKKKGIVLASASFRSPTFPSISR